jgi:type IV pilus modification protein PilV
MTGQIRTIAMQIRQGILSMIDRKQITLIRNEDGLTLIETLIALAIFAIGILGVAQLQMWNIQNNTNGNITTQASLLAQDKLEELKNVADPATITNGSDAPMPNYARAWTATTPAPACANCTQLDVTVTYSGQGQNRQISLTTVLR